MIHPDNLVVRKLYSSMGFFDAGNVILAEAYISKGMHLWFTRMDEGSISIVESD